MTTSASVATTRDSSSHLGITVVRYVEEIHKGIWDGFVERSMNGTKFHMQSFLAYHPEGRFPFHHLLFYCGPRLVALLPGLLRIAGDGMKTYESPAGSSYGSFVVEDVSAETALAVVHAFESYIGELGVSDVYLTSAPVIYQPVLTQNLDFALLYCGYYYSRHYISHAIDLAKDGEPFSRFQSTSRKLIRQVKRRNPLLTVEHIAAENLREGLKEFYPILLENKLKHSATPTHSLDELLRLTELVPGLMQLFIVRLEGVAIAGSLLFIANPRVALIFYHAHLYRYNEYRPIYLLMEKVSGWAKSEGYAFVDIGVSQDTHDANPMTPALSLIAFKEKFDSRGVLRSTMHKHYAG